MGAWESARRTHPPPLSSLHPAVTTSPLSLSTRPTNTQPAHLVNPSPSVATPPAAGAIQIDDAMLADLLRGSAASPPLPSSAHTTTPAQPPPPAAEAAPGDDRDYTPHLSTAEAVRGRGVDGPAPARLPNPEAGGEAGGRAGPLEAAADAAPHHGPPSPVRSSHRNPSLATATARLARRDATIASLRAALADTDVQAGALEAARAAARSAVADAAAARRQRGELAAGVGALRAAAAADRAASAAANAEARAAVNAARFAAAREATAAARVAGLVAKLGRRDEVLGRMHETLAALGARVTQLQEGGVPPRRHRRPVVTREAGGVGAAVGAPAAAPAPVVAALEAELVAARAEVGRARSAEAAAVRRAEWLEGEVSAFKASIVGHLATAGLSVPFE